MLEVPNGEDGRWESDVWDGGGASLELEASDGGWSFVVSNSSVVR